MTNKRINQGTNPTKSKVLKIATPKRKRPNAQLYIDYGRAIEKINFHKKWLYWLSFIVAALCLGLKPTDVIKAVLTKFFGQMD